MERRSLAARLNSFQRNCRRPFLWRSRGWRSCPDLDSGGPGLAHRCRLDPPSSPAPTRWDNAPSNCCRHYWKHCGSEPGRDNTPPKRGCCLAQPRHCLFAGVGAGIKPGENGSGGWPSVIVDDGEVVRREIGANRVGLIFLHDKTERLAAGSQSQIIDSHRHLCRGLADGKSNRLIQNPAVKAVVAVALILHRAGIHGCRR